VMPSLLDDADSHARPLFERLLQACAMAGVPCRIVDVIRTEPQQEQKLAAGLSWTRNSMHLPQPPEGKSKAIDIVPLSVLEEHKPDWSPTDPSWQKIGVIGKSLGLTWGGDWKHINNGLGDPSHFQDDYKPQDAVAGVTSDIAS
jgi:D-alanyl-D-alanine carboxypeptidase